MVFGSIAAFGASWGIGANDVANSFATSKLLRCVCVCVFELQEGDPVLCTDRSVQTFGVAAYTHERPTIQLQLHAFCSLDFNSE